VRTPGLQGIIVLRHCITQTYDRDLRIYFGDASSVSSAARSVLFLRLSQLVQPK
jgi:hypothetical protein